MKEIYIGDVIRQRRRALKLTQEKLCEGLCDQATLSRLENGNGNPSRTIINATLQKLDLEGGRFYARLTDQEETIEGLCRELVSCNSRFQNAKNENRPSVRAEAYRVIHTLEALMDPDDHITAQFLLRSRVYLGKEDNIPYRSDEALDIMTKAIRLTVPRFSADNLADGLYCLDEIKVINQIAVIYASAGQREKAMDIWQQLLIYAQGHFKNVTESAAMLPLITHNYAGGALRSGSIRKSNGDSGNRKKRLRRIWPLPAARRAPSHDCGMLPFLRRQHSEC